MFRYKISIEYDGTNFCGWQRQKDGPSIQESIGIALNYFLNKPDNAPIIDIIGSGRTDAGVHALAQIAHFDLENEYDEYKICGALNFYLRKIFAAKNCPITITQCKKAGQDFHARFDAKEKLYRYKILNRPNPSPLRALRSWHVSHVLDLKNMQDGAKYLLGQHDFSSFRDSECQAKNPIRSIDLIEIYQNEDEIWLDFKAKSFLHHMIRNIVGTLYLVGSNKITPAQIKEILEAQDRTKAGPTAPAHGLYLISAQYCD